MNIVLIISQIVLAIVFLVPTAVYGGIIGNRIAVNEFYGKALQRFFCIIIFSILGAVLFPLTMLIMIRNWDSAEEGFDKILDTIFSKFER